MLWKDSFHENQTEEQNLVEKLNPYHDIKENETNRKNLFY